MGEHRSYDDINRMQSSTNEYVFNFTLKFKVKFLPIFKRSLNAIFNHRHPALQAQYGYPAPPSPPFHRYRGFPKE